MRLLPWLAILIFFGSCAKSKEQEVLQAIDVAQTYLSQEKCDSAIVILEAAGSQPSNAIYNEVLASAYACRAKFVATAFIGTDIPKINASLLMNSVASLTLSQESVVDSTAYVSLRTALGILQATDGQVNREALFGVRKAGDIGVQIIMLSIVQLGKFLNYYGSTNAVGTKGQRSSNRCFINYSGDAANWVTSYSQSCHYASDGHADMLYTGSTAAVGKRRLCEGLMLVTNVLDVLTNVDLTGSDTLRSLETVANEVQDYKDDALALDPTLGTLLNTTSQSACETLLADATQLDNMQKIYALIFEAGLL